MNADIISMFMKLMPMSMWIQKSRLDAEQFDTRLPNISSSSKLRNQIPQNRVPQNLYFFVSNLKEKDRTNIWLFHIQSRKKKAMAKYYVISYYSSLLWINYGGGLKVLLAILSPRLKHLTRTFEIASALRITINKEDQNQNKLGSNSVLRYWLACSTLDSCSISLQSVLFRLLIKNYIAVVS